MPSLMAMGEHVPANFCRMQTRSCSLILPPILAPLGTAFPDYLETEVMPAIAAKYPVQTGPEHTAIWGASYGGVAAVYALIHRSDLFGAGIVESPALEAGNGQLLRDTAELVKAPKRIAI